MDYEVIYVYGCSDCPWGGTHYSEIGKPTRPQHCGLSYPAARSLEDVKILPPEWCRLKRIPVVHKRYEEHPHQEDLFKLARISDLQGVLGAVRRYCADCPTEDKDPCECSDCHLFFVWSVRTERAREVEKP